MFGPGALAEAPIAALVGTAMVIGTIDRLLIGETRIRLAPDALGTVDIAIRAALTGHLVFSTLHTNDAVGGITRLLDMGMDPFNFSDSLLGILAQRLVRRLCKACVTSRPATPDELEALATQYLESVQHVDARDVAAQIARWTEQHGQEDGHGGRYLRTFIKGGAGCTACEWSISPLTTSSLPPSACVPGGCAMLAP